MYFVAMLIRLRLLNTTKPLTIADVPLLHAALYTEVSTIDLVISQHMHDLLRYKNMTLALVESTHKTATVRLTVMDTTGVTFANVLLTALAPEKAMRIGRTIAIIDAVDLSDGLWTGVATWETFQNAHHGPKMHFKFATPTAFMQGTGVSGRFTALLPEPLAIFSGLAYRWRALDGPSLPDDLCTYVQEGGCVIEKYSIYTCAYPTQHRIQLGFVGEASYTTPQKESSYLIALNTLTRFAAYAGIGYQTTRGMGLVRTWITGK